VVDIIFIDYDIIFYMKSFPFLRIEYLGIVFIILCILVFGFSFYL
jgi:hypothetical protein